MKNLVKKMMFLVFISGTAVLTHSCEEVEKAINGLSNEEVIEGLKMALNVGTDTSVTTLNAVDGYLKDEAVKILLPDESAVLISNISKVPGLDILVDETVKAINRSAEDAAIEAKPIFVNAITNISITDGFAILNGADDEATKYLETNTYSDLVSVFKPKISTSLNKELVNGVSAESAYARLITTYNAASLNGTLFKKIETNTLTDHTTKKALDGLFLKVAEEEGKIRNDVTHRVNDILKKVFGE